MNLTDLSVELNIPKQKLCALAFGRKEYSRYKEFTVKKRGGGQRNIAAPTAQLSLVQSKIHRWLETQYRPPAPAHAFIETRGIVTNANKHRRRNLVLNLDLKEFFPSITTRRVYGLLKSPSIGLDAKAALVLSKLLTHRGRLPQGAPSSPTVSNMICKKLDRELMALANKLNCFYTRYADDLTFSTNMPGFSEDILIRDGTSVKLGSALLEIIHKNGFEVNSRKTRLASRNCAQYVTGIKTNKFLNVDRFEIKKIRAILHAIEKFGYSNANSLWKNKFANPEAPSQVNAELAAVVKGHLAFISQVRGKGDHLYLSLATRASRIPEIGLALPSHSLAARWNEIISMPDPQHRGYQLEGFIRTLCEESSLNVSGPFKRNGGNEQIDGAFEVDNRHVIVECKFEKEPMSATACDPFYAKVARSGVTVFGLFLSISGWRNGMPENLQQMPTKQIILMNGKDIEKMLEERKTFAEVVRTKIEGLATRTEPYTPV